jgi:hypothetical protein
MHASLHGVFTALRAGEITVRETLRLRRRELLDSLTVRRVIPLGLRRRKARFDESLRLRDDVIRFIAGTRHLVVHDFFDRATRHSTAAFTAEKRPWGQFGSAVRAVHKTLFLSLEEPSDTITTE